MRIMPKAQVASVLISIHVWLLLSAVTAWAALRSWAGAGAFGHLAVFLAAGFIYGVTAFRSAAQLFPLSPGDIPQDSRSEFIYNVVHLPAYFFLYCPLAFSGLVPIPLTRAFARLFGAKIGEGTYPARCTIYDPLFVQIGRGVVLGHQSVLTPHVLEGDRLAIHAIRIGDGATIGVNAVILAGVTVGEGAVVAAGAVVPKFTKIGPREIWGGLPAKRIGFVDGRPPAGEPARFPTVDRAGVA